MVTLAKIDTDAEYTFGEPNFTGSPERNLLVAILERAILDYVGNDEREINEAEKWLFSGSSASDAGSSSASFYSAGSDSNSDDSDEGEEDDGEFTFFWICQQLDLDPQKISRIIRAMPKRGSRRVAPWYFSNHEDFLRKAS